MISAQVAEPDSTVQSCVDGKQQLKMACIQSFFEIYVNVSV